MGHCYHHALSSARKWGGTAETICRCTNGSTSRRKSRRTSGTARCATMPGHIRLERTFGAAITISTGRVVPVRLIGEQHVLEDLRLHPELCRWVLLHPASALDGSRPAIHKLVDPSMSLSRPKPSTASRPRSDGGLITAIHPDPAIVPGGRQACHGRWDLLDVDGARQSAR